MNLFAWGDRSVVGVGVGFLARRFVGIGVAGGLGAVGQAGYLGVGFLCLGKEIVDVAGVLGHGVGDEGQGGREADSGALADFGAQDAFGAVQSRGSAGGVGSGLEIVTEDRVINGRVAKVAGYLRVRNGDAGQPRI